MNSIKATPGWLVWFVVICWVGLVGFGLVLGLVRPVVGCDLLWGRSKTNTNSECAEQKATTAKMLPISVTKSSETVKKYATKRTRLKYTGQLIFINCCKKL